MHKRLHRATVGAFHDNGQLMYHYASKTVDTIAEGVSWANNTIRQSSMEWDFTITEVA